MKLLKPAQRRPARTEGIDIIIATAHRTNEISALIPRIRSQMSIHDRLIVIFQGTTPCISETPNSVIIALKRPNLPRARNAGVRAGKNNLVCFLDDDVVPHDGLLDAHARAHRLFPRAGCIAGYISDPLFDSTAPVPSYFNPRTGELIQNFAQHRSSPAISAMGANMSFKRTALEAIGGFDECFTGNALWEEIDCTFRMRKAGYAVWFWPNAKVDHMRSPLGGCRTATAGRYVFHQFANTAYFACRHAPPRYWRTWLQFWKYRLEYQTRRSLLGLKHDPRLILAGCMGALVGVCRFFLCSRLVSPSFRLSGARMGSAA